MDDEGIGSFGREDAKHGPGEINCWFFGLLIDYKGGLGHQREWEYRNFPSSRYEMCRWTLTKGRKEGNWLEKYSVGTQKYHLDVGL